MSLCIELYRSQKLKISFDTSHDDFGFLEAELQEHFKQLDFQDSFQVFLTQLIN